MSSTRSTPIAQLSAQDAPVAPVTEEDDQLVQDILNQINDDMQPPIPKAPLPRPQQATTSPSPSYHTRIPDDVVPVEGWTLKFTGELKAAVLVASAVVIVHYIPVASLLDSALGSRYVTSPLHKIAARAALTAAVAFALNRALS